MTSEHGADHPSTIRGLIRQAESAIAEGDHGRARSMYWQAIDGDLTPLARSEYSRYLVETGQYREAILQLNELLTFAQEADDKRLLTATASNLAVAYRDLGESDLAEQFQQIAVAAALEVNTGELTGCELANCANDAILAGDLKRAEQLFCAALAWEMEHGEDDASAAGDFLGLGTIAGLQGDFATAQTRLMKAYRLHSQSDDRRGMGIALLNLAEFATRDDRWRQAARCLEEAADCFQRAGLNDLHDRSRSDLSRVRRYMEIQVGNPRVN